MLYPPSATIFSIFSSDWTLPSIEARRRRRFVSELEPMSSLRRESLIDDESEARVPLLMAVENSSYASKRSLLVPSMESWALHPLQVTVQMWDSFLMSSRDPHLGQWSTGTHFTSSCMATCASYQTLAESQEDAMAICRSNREVTP